MQQCHLWDILTQWISNNWTWKAHPFGNIAQFLYANNLKWNQFAQLRYLCLTARTLFVLHHWWSYFLKVENRSQVDFIKIVEFASIIYVCLHSQKQQSLTGCNECSSPAVWFTVPRPNGEKAPLKTREFS